MELVNGLDISDFKSLEWTSLKHPWLQISNKWRCCLYMMPDNIMITISQVTKKPMKLTRLIVELTSRDNVTMIQTFSNIEFTSYKPFGIFFPKIDYIRLLKIHMETDVQDYKYSFLTEEEYEMLPDDTSKIFNGEIDTKDFILYERETNHKERRAKKKQERLARGLSW